MCFWILCINPRDSLADAGAAVELLKEVHGAQSRGVAPPPLRGLVFATASPIPANDLAALGVAPFE